MKKLEIYNFSESTYNMKLFGAKKVGERVDVTYFAKIRSKRAFLLRLLKLPHMHNATANWIRQRIHKGSGNMEMIINDDSIYVEAEWHPDVVIGKFTPDNKWVPFNPPLKAQKPIASGFSEDEKNKVMPAKEELERRKKLRLQLPQFNIIAEGKVNVLVAMTKKFHPDWDWVQVEDFLRRLIGNAIEKGLKKEKKES